MPLAEIDLMVAMDLVGHAVGPPGLPDAVRTTLFALGAERSEGTGALVESVAVPGLVVRRADADVIPPLSDHWPFWRASVPFMEEHDILQRDLQAQRKLLETHRLRPPAEAKTVRLRSGGDRAVTDGPFTESKEVMGGYYTIECDSMAEALDWARRVPLAYGSVEVRPVWE